MAVELLISCSMCGNTVEISEAGEGDSIGSRTLVDAVKKALKRPWVVQVNGNNIDTYCCAKCAK